MILFNNDYSEGCHPRILERLAQTNFEQTQGYGMDPHCENAAALIRKCCNREDLSVHFLVGGTQANLTVIDAIREPFAPVPVTFMSTKPVPWKQPDTKSWLCHPMTVKSLLNR